MLLKVNTIDYKLNSVLQDILNYLPGVLLQSFKVCHFNPDVLSFSDLVREVGCEPLRQLGEVAGYGGELEKLFECPF